MIPSQKHLLAPIKRHRWLEVTAGLLIGTIGGMMLVGAVLLLSVLIVRPGMNPPVSAIVVFFTFGSPCPFVAWRLITGRMREDGGLFSPTELRVAGVYFALSWLIAIKTIWVFEALLLSLTCTAACFGLARHRQNAASEYSGSAADKGDK